MSQSTVTLIIYILLLAPAMIVGFVFARRKMFAPYHKFTMTGITIFNWVLIIALMLVSYRNYVAPGLPDNLSDIRNLLATLHLVTGAMAQLLATYLVILMWTERTSIEGLLPSALRIRRIKTPMRLTLALWLTTVVLGIGIYLTWYVATPQSDAGQPVATEEATVEANGTPNPLATEAVDATEAAEPASTEDTDVAVTEAPEPEQTEEAED